VKQLPLATELQEIARRVNWFEPPAQATSDPIRFLAYVMTYGTFKDVATVRQFLSDDEVIEALDHAPAGIFDPRSWAYWNLKLGRYPTPPMPERTIIESYGGDSQAD
jgi:hypothetical protein